MALTEVTIETTLFETFSAMSAIEPSVKFAELPSMPLSKKVIGVEDFSYPSQPKISPPLPKMIAATDSPIA